MDDNITKIEDELKEQLKKAYLRGISVGGKTFVGLIYDIIIEAKKKRVNPAKTVIKIENSCKRLLNVSDKYYRNEVSLAIEEKIRNFNSEVSNEQSTSN